MSLASFDRLMESLYGIGGYTKGIDVELGLIHAFPDFMRDGWNVIKAGDFKRSSRFW